MQEIIRLVATNDRGMRIGEYHQNSNLSDKEVDQIRDLHEFAGWSYRDIARAYGASKSCIAEICRYEKRNQTVFDWKKVRVIPGNSNGVEDKTPFVPICPTKQEMKSATAAAGIDPNYLLNKRGSRAKITKNQIMEIIKKFRNGESCRRLSVEYKVSVSTIESYVVRERNRNTVRVKKEVEA